MLFEYGKDYFHPHRRGSDYAPHAYWAGGVMTLPGSRVLSYFLHIRKHWKDYFYGGDNNSSQAYHVAKVVAMGLVVLALVSFMSPQNHHVANSERSLSGVLPSMLIELTNENRAEVGLDGLKANETLQAAAQLKADHMAENGYFAHYAPDGTTPWEWFAQAGYEYDLAGENLAINFSDSEDLAQAWMDSSQHRDNMLKEGYTEVGIATAKGEYKGRETVFVVQMFAHPSATELAQREAKTGTATVVNRTEEKVTINKKGSDMDTGTADDVSLIARAPNTEESPTPVAQVQGESGTSLQPSNSNVSQLTRLINQLEFLFRTSMLNSHDHKGGDSIVKI